MEKKIRTIAFQVDDQEFVKQYEDRVKESGLSVKNYFISLIKADIMARGQSREADPVKETAVAKEETEIKQAANAPAADVTEAPEPGQAAIPAQKGETEPEQGTEPEQAKEAKSEQESEPEHEAQPEQEAEPGAKQEADQPSAIISNDVPAAEVPDAKQNEAAQAEPEEMMSLFVKITKDLREALDYRKSETGESVGNTISRLVADFLENVRNGYEPEGLVETFSYYAENPDVCDTKASAKIPVKSNQELADYLAENGGTRNTLMAALVHMEVYGQEQEQGQSMVM